MKKLVAFALWFWLMPAQADNCDQPKDDFDGLYCLNKIYMQADKDLNAVYQRLRAKLDAEGRELIQARQLAWIDDRNRRCSYRNDKGFFVNLKCATKSTVDQVRFLDDRYRECASVGCLNSKLK